MITLHDLETAIAKCQGDSHPDVNTCIKLAAYYTIKRAMYEEAPEPSAGYSFAAPPVEPIETVDYLSDSEFSRAVDGKPLSEVWPVIDELMTTLQIINPRLYAGVLRQLEK